MPPQEMRLNIDWPIAGGLLAGALAGGAARFGRLCTMGAIEDALVGRDFRQAKAWGLALAVAIAATQIGAAAGLIDLSRNTYSGAQVHVLGVLVGGLMFGLGMTLAGTCSFGLIVRAGGGDLRAVVASAVVGVFAFAFTAGVLAPLRTPFLTVGVVDTTGTGAATIDGLLSRSAGPFGARAIVAAIVLSLVGLAILDLRLRRRPRLLVGATLLGLSIAAGWLATTTAVNALALDHAESLSFVAPVGRALLQFMMEPFRNLGFGVAAVAGALLASFAVAAWRGDLRWEAFDDAREMRRHLFGAALMGLGGVLAQGCTIGQGLSAASTLAVTAPLFMIAVLGGAKLGLSHLIEGWPLWRVTFSSRMR